MASSSLLPSMATSKSVPTSDFADSLRYEGYDARFDIPWRQKRIEWMYSSNSTGVGIGPVTDVNSPDITCRFTPLKAPALKAVARAGSEVVYKWTDYYNSHKGPVITVGCSSFIQLY
jgi:cellulase